MVEFFLLSFIKYIFKQLSFTFFFIFAVIKLNEDNFHEEVGEKPENILYVVEFYVSWCSPCQQLQPEWVKLAQQVIT